MANIIDLPILYIPDPNGGRPIANGFIYIGNPDTDPEIPANQKSVTSVDEDGNTFSVVQPIRTTAGGVPVQNNSVLTKLLVEENYSVKINDSLGSQIYYIAADSASEGLTPLTNANGIRIVQDLVSLKEEQFGIPDESGESFEPLVIYLLGRSEVADGDEGIFITAFGDRSAEVAADPNEEIWVAPSENPFGDAGAWKREQGVNPRLLEDRVETLETSVTSIGDQVNDVSSSVAVANSRTASALQQIITTIQTDAEKAVWQVRAASLDPAAIVHLNVDSGWSGSTVPVGETWHARSLVNCQIGGTQCANIYAPSESDILPLPEGTVIGNGLAGSYFTYVNISLVSSDLRYDEDPKGLYFERINRLKELTVFVNSAAVSSGQPAGTTIDSNFPANFTNGLIVSQSLDDCHSFFLRGTNAEIPLYSTVPNNLAVSFSSTPMLPFVRTTFTRVSAVGGNRDNDSSNTVAGEGVVNYVKLPGDW